MRKTYQGVIANQAGQFRGNWQNRIVIATTKDKRPTEKSLFNISYIGRVGGIARRITETVKASEICFRFIGTLPAY